MPPRPIIRSSSALDTTSSIERAWVERIRQGDVAAFEAAFHALFPGLCTFVARQLGSHEAAEDITQDLFLSLWRQRTTLDIHETLSTYLYRAARNRALNVLQRDRLTSRAVALDEAAQSTARLTIDRNAADELLEAEMIRGVYRAVDTMSPRAREVFLLSRREGMGYAQIAATLGLSVKTVEAHMARALRTLRDHLKSLVP